MRANTEAQLALHPAVVGSAARTVLDLARSHGVAGKVNGAGGEGGSVTLLLPDDPEEGDRLLDAVGAADPAFRLIPTRLSEAGARSVRSSGG